MASEVVKSIVEKVKVFSDEQQEKVLEFVTNIEPEGRTPWQIWQELSAEIPEEEFDNIPTDASINLDHYLYGASKK